MGNDPSDMAMDQQNPPLASSTSAPIVPSHCGYCAKPWNWQLDKFCALCGFPQHGTDQERSNFIYDRGLEKGNKTVADEQVRKARHALLIVAALNMIPYLIAGGAVLIVTGLVISCMFLGLAFWTKHKPLPAIITALSLYGLLILLAAIEEPASLFSGIILKVIVISALIYALRALKQPVTSKRK